MNYTFLDLRFGWHFARTQCRWCALLLVTIVLPMCEAETSGQSRGKNLSPVEIGEILNRLHTAVQDYVFPEVAAKLAQELAVHDKEYRNLADPSALAQRLTADMRSIALDQHLAVTFGEELAVLKNPTAEEKQHAHLFDHANGYGLRSARRLPGNIGYVDVAYFSPDPDAGAAMAAAMQIVNGTDALILDLRRNHGGSGEAEITLASYFLPDVTLLSSVVENVNGKRQERQHWSVAYLQAPRYLGKPVYILTSRETHSAAEAMAYDLHNLHLATIIGEHTSGDATSSRGEVDLGHGLSAFIPNGQLISPITHRNYFRAGVQPDLLNPPEKALLTAYELALKTAKMSVDSEILAKEKSEAIKNPGAALSQELDGFPQQR